MADTPTSPNHAIVAEEQECLPIVTSTMRIVLETIATLRINVEHLENGEKSNYREQQLGQAHGIRTAIIAMHGMFSHGLDYSTVKELVDAAIENGGTIPRHMYVEKDNHSTL